MSVNDDTGTSSALKDPRFLLALGVLALSILGTVGLAWYVISINLTDPKVSERIFTMVLPLLGTWVGTILAYYFSRENFEAANASVQKMAASLSSMEKLASIGVEGKQIPTSDINPILSLTTDKDESAYKLTSDIQTLFESSNRNRMPVLDSRGLPLYMIHRSMIDRFVVEQASQKDVSGKQIKDLTLKDLLDKSPEMKQMFKASFVTVAKSETLADAKQKMDQTPNCSDVFVTEDGTSKTPVVGWLTNWIISKEAQV